MAKKPEKKTGEKVSLGYAWYALFVLFLINLINYIDRLSIGPAFEHIKRDFQISDMQIGMIAGAFMLVYALLSLPMGYLSDKGQRTRIVAIGAFVWSLATTVSGFCRTFWGFFFARAGVGSGEGIYAPSGTAIVADYFPKRLRNTSIAIFMSAMIVGGALAYIVAGVILNKTERFKVDRVKEVLIDEGQQTLDGWSFRNVEETLDRHVRFNFESPEGTKLSAIFSRFEEVEEGDRDIPDFQSLLFNVDYQLNGKDVKPEEMPPEVAGFAEFLNDRIAKREHSGLDRVEVPIGDLPHSFKLGDAQKGPTGELEHEILMSGIAEIKQQKNWFGDFWDSLLIALGNAEDSEDPAEKLEKSKEILADYEERLKYIELPEGETKELGFFAKIFLHGAGEARGKLVYYGILTKNDLLRLGLLTDNEHFSKSISILNATAKYHYLRSDNWRWIFWILGPPGLLLALLAWFLKEPLKGGSEEFLSEEEAKRVEEAGKTDYSILWRTPSIVLMVFSNILATYCVGGLNAWLFPFVERYKGVESADAAVIFGPYVVGCAVLGVILSGIAADKLQKVTPRGNNIIIVLGILLSIPPMYLFLDAQNQTVMLVCICLTIFFMTWINGPMNALLMTLVEPRLRAMLNGVHILLIHLLGDAISPFIIGYYSDKVNLRYALAMLPLFLVVGAIGFGIAGIFVPRDVKAVETRMKNIAGSGADGDAPPPAH